MSQLSDLLVFLITIGIPECISMAMVLVAALRLEFRWKKILQISIILSLIIFIVRLTVVKAIITPGIHSAIAVLTLALLVAYFYQTSKLLSLTTSIIVMFLLGTLETFTFKLSETIFQHDLHDLVQNKLIWIFTNWLHIILLAVIAFLITRTNWYRRGRT
ncbi:hypothetical protein IT084_00735 [Desulfallas sp. Bu1-1]|uniref:hypothetical protein n=1 Tax=Desulfallas sp. Bu1-1 TaxID=2787620 RepID=UPI00189D72EC|nr:hypothetical protein [Desulfallas sp. Bu1-1]MBF7081507.1 hypothetical protein [Desulfallas sp. Bu1-1]